MTVCTHVGSGLNVAYQQAASWSLVHLCGGGDETLTGVMAAAGCSRPLGCVLQQCQNSLTVIIARRLISQRRTSLAANTDCYHCSPAGECETTQLVVCGSAKAR